MECLFSYGTLQLKNVQLKNFGRILNGTPDKIQGYKLCSVKIQDERVLSISSQKLHPILKRTADLNDEVSGVVFQLNPDELKKADEFSISKGFDKLMLGVDHMATRILSSDRECAILECISMTNYYFWGAFNIKDMNSSTNVTRHPSVKSDRHSPAKVFTANNTPYFVNAFNGSPMPTEDFVRNVGPRMHHIAQEIIDGKFATGEELKNIEKKIDTEISESVKNALEAPEPPSQELTKYIWADD